MSTLHRLGIKNCISSNKNSNNGLANEAKIVFNDATELKTLGHCQCEWAPGHLNIFFFSFFFCFFGQFIKWRAADKAAMKHCGGFVTYVILTWAR